MCYSFEDIVVQIQSNVVFFDKLVYDGVVEPELSVSDLIDVPNIQEPISRGGSYLAGSWQPSFLFLF
jgi:hypothetical protein